MLRNTERGCGSTAADFALELRGCGLGLRRGSKPPRYDEHWSLPEAAVYVRDHH